jgi:uncharacterized protein (TIGR03066 family)
MMKKVFAFLAAALVLAACGGKDNPEPEKTVSVVGTWELSNVATKASVGSVSVSVYVQFAADGSFLLYQKVGEGRFSAFSGTFKLEGGKLSGKYSNGSSWGPYEASVTNSSLTLTTAGGKEVDTYTKISSIPASVTSNLY